MTSLTTNDVVISVAELREAFTGGTNVVLLDVCRTADIPLREEYDAGHLPGAHFGSWMTSARSTAPIGSMA